MAGLVGVHTGLLLGHHQHHAQRLPFGLAAQRTQGFQCRHAAGALAGEVSQLVDALPGHGAQAREQRAQCLANAGGRLGQQATAVHRGAIDRFGQLALPLSKRQAGKRQLMQRPVARAAVQRFLLRPSGEQGATLVEGFFQLGNATQLLEFGLGLRGHVKVDQRQRHLGQLAAAAEQSAIGLQLRPMQLTPVFRDVVGASTDGLDLFQAAVARVVTIGPAAQVQRADIALQRDLGFVVLTSAAGHQALTLEPFHGGGRRRESTVQVAALGSEFAQGPDRHGVGPGLRFCWLRIGSGQLRIRCHAVSTGAGVVRAAGVAGGDGLVHGMLAPHGSACRRAHR